MKDFIAGLVLDIKTDPIAYVVAVVICLSYTAIVYGSSAFML